MDYIKDMGENIINKKEHVLTNLEISSTKLRRPSQSMKNVLKKEPIYDSSFLKVREFNCDASVSFDENDQAIVTIYFPTEIQIGMKNGTIPFDQKEFIELCKKFENKARAQRKLKSNPTRVWRS